MAIELSEKQIRDGWQIVKFGEIAKNISKRVEPSETDLEVYVGLEHLDPQSLRITRRGVPTDVKGQKLRVRPGQIIFGKRRAYQKKVAVADFEGICSAHAMVLEEVVGKIIPGLLPFFMQSDMFMDRAVAISEGSLSPTIKWKTLAIQEFPLPPIERQKEILEVLEKVEDNSNRKGDFVNYFLKAKDSTRRQLMLRDFTFSQLFMKKDLSLPQGWKLTTLGKVLTSIQYGLSEALLKEGEYPVLRMMNFENGYVSPNDLKFIDLSKKQAEKFKLNRGDVLFNRTNSMELVGRTGLFDLEGDYLFASYLLRLVVDTKKITPLYLSHYLNLQVVQYRLKAFATPGVSQANINPTSLKSIHLLLPPIEEINRIENVLQEIDSITEVIGKYDRVGQTLNSKVGNRLLEMPSQMEVSNELQ